MDGDPVSPIAPYDDQAAATSIWLDWRRERRAARRGFFGNVIYTAVMTVFSTAGGLITWRLWQDQGDAGPLLWVGGGTFALAVFANWGRHDVVSSWNRWQRARHQQLVWGHGAPAKALSLMKIVGAAAAVATFLGKQQPEILHKAVDSVARLARLALEHAQAAGWLT